MKATKTFKMRGGRKVAVSVKVRKLFVDGTNMGVGCFTSDAPFVSGGGRIISGNGVTIIFR